MSITSVSPKSGDQSIYPRPKPLTFGKYTMRNLGLGLGVEAIARHFGWVQCSPFGSCSVKDSLSPLTGLKKLDYFQLIPTVQAEEVDTLVQEATTPTQPIPDSAQSGTEATLGVFAQFSKTFDSVKDRVSGFGPTNAFTGYVCENKEWLTVAGSIISIYSTVNYLIAARVKPRYVRNVLSMSAGVGITWIAAYVLGYQPNAKLITDIGLRIMTYHGFIQASAWLCDATRLTDPMAFPSKVRPKKLTRNTSK